jgi:inorganic pyrophosphatase
MGSVNKYELDKESGLLRLDRVLYSAVHYPANYGFIPRTFCDDGDPLDALVIGQEPVHPMTVLDARAIGVMRMRDEKGIDDKILAVSVRDPAVYKLLEHKQVVVEEFMGPEEAVKILEEALDMYRRLRRGEIARK